jgi:indolepyruvate ferredoxin oxidoreductase beta subunit
MHLQIVLVGVGGGGIIFMTKVLAETALKQGLEVIGSETHGMSQRGGSVVSHLKLGRFQSPLVRRGTADVLIALNAEEAFKSVDYLAEGGKCIVNAVADQFPGEALKGYVAQRSLECATLTADTIALELGAPAVANMIMLGFAAECGALPFSIDQLAEAVNLLSSERLRVAHNEGLRRGAKAVTIKERVG